MKKKAIIIPVILLSSLLGACNRLSLFEPKEEKAESDVPLIEQKEEEN